MAIATPLLDGVLRRDRLIVAAALAGIVGLAWLYLIDMAGVPATPTGSMAGMDMGGAMAAPMAWDVRTFALTFLMWGIMMVGMMLPSAAPMILLYAAVQRKSARGSPFPAIASFVAGYVLVWTIFALGATLVQWALAEAALLSPSMAAAGHVFGGLLFVAAGLYQLTPLKTACLTQCRSPLQFVTTRWRPGRGGALRMGVEHGVYCLGCCWVLMGLLFAVGVMNLLWVAIIAGFVLAEKVVPRGDWLGRASGILMIAAGAVLAWPAM